MNLDEYRRRGKEMVDYIADYLETIRERRVFPNVQPGYMKAVMPDSAPVEGEEFSEIMKDFERVIMPGVTHWQSPYMHAYFPALNCPASMLGDMLADGINCLGFTWASSPACTELEIIVTDWLAKMIGLPEEFLHLTPNSTGGGVIQTTSCEATFIALLAARKEAIRRLKEIYKYKDDTELNIRLVAYTSDQAHSSVEKAGLMGLVKMRFIETDSTLSLRADKLLTAIAHDKEKGLIPFFLCATLGTTGACAFDNLEEIGPICARENVWIHVDSAYAGTAFICPEFRKWMKGVEFAESFAFNPSKWMMVHFDCTTMWVKNSVALHRTFCVDPLYLKHENSGLAVDFMHWQIPLSKRFRALKLWFVIRNYGIKGLQNHVRKSVELAKAFEMKVRSDQRFEVPVERHLGMVVFRIRGDNELTEDLLKKLNASGKLHCVPAKLKEKYVIRFTVTSASTTVEDIERDWNLIKEFAEMLLPSLPRKRNISLAEIHKKNAHFGTSLLLSNTTMIPRVINGSFVAMATQTEEAHDFLRQYDQSLREMARSSPMLHRKIVKKFLTPDRQLSLDSHMDLMDLVVNATEPAVKTSDCKNRKASVTHGALAFDLQAPHDTMGEKKERASPKNTGRPGMAIKKKDEDYYNDF